MRRLKLTGIDEGYSVIVSTKLVGADDPELVLDSILKIFLNLHVACLKSKISLPNKMIF